jgi:putative two-component system response regulator
MDDMVLPTEPTTRRSSIQHVSTFLPGLQKERILVVEDNRHLGALLERVLSPTYTVLMAEDGIDALEKIGPFEPNLILSDVMMPRMTGTQLLEKIRQDSSLARLPFILLTANANVKDRAQGLWNGANDYITKPFDVPELLARINNLLRLKSFEQQLSLNNQKLFGDKESLERELRKRFMNTVSVLVGAIDCKDAYTAGHSERVAYYAGILAKPFDLRPDEMETLELGALMHDVGKIGIPDAVLNKPGKLTDEEHRIIQLHPTYADQILRRAPELDLVRQVVVHHHERWDGKGYPLSPNR